ncbi:MAG: hypothetical protein LBF68_04535 [Christensenellaceae bacterium]|jgi:hypothetical protein|nr:hypothetical protein [Christensenellaceae bacterium]
MIIKDSFSVLSINIGLIFKTFIYTFILMIIFFAIMSSVIRPIADMIFIDFEFSEQLRLAFDRWLQGEIDSFRALFKEIMRFVSSESSRTGIVAFNMIVVYVIFMFFIQMTTIPITKVLYNKMSQGYDERFHMSLISTLGLSLAYSTFNALTGALVDLIIIVFGIVLLVLLFNVMNIYAITIAIITILILLAIRISFVIMLAPIMITEEKNVFKAFLLSIKRTPKMFSKIFPVILTVILAVFAICMCTVAVTFGIIPIFLVPTYMVLMSSISLIVYFISQKRKYYAVNVLDFIGRVDSLSQNQISNQDEIKPSISMSNEACLTEADESDINNTKIVDEPDNTDDASNTSDV